MAVAGAEAGSPLLRLDEHPAACLRMVCFHHAGGTAWEFRDWARQLPEWVELHAVQLPGRGTRAREPIPRCLRTLASLLTKSLPTADKPFVLFGHSLGALVAFEVARQLSSVPGASPRRVFVAAARPPHLPPSRPLLHELSAEQLVEALTRAGGIPPSVLDHPDLLAALLPTLQADLELAETYRCGSQDRLDCDIGVFGAREDWLVRPEDLRAWRDLTNSEFSMRMIPGDHLFHGSRTRLLALLRRDLERTVREVMC